MLNFYGKSFSSRLLIGSALYPSPAIMQAAIRASGANIVTVSLRREAAGGKTGDAFWNLIRELNVTVLPNTAGCRSVREAVTTAKLARELFGTKWIKLEVIADNDTLQPDVVGLVEAADILIKDGFEVFPYCTEDLSVAIRLVDAGCKVVMPWAAPIGSAKGIINPDALKLLREAGEKFKLLVISEVMEISQIPMMLPYVDILQVGARNMQNFNLLRELGKVRKPVLLKRGIAATFEELLLSAEYVMSGGNYDVILCERGIRTFETYTRNTMDISAIPIIHKLSHLPMTADPSHGTGRRDKVAPMARASVAAGADALLIEVHCDPNKAWSDGAQSLFPEQFAKLMDELRMIAPAVGRKIG